MQKLKRLCFIYAIIDEDQTLSHVPEEEKSKYAKDDFMLDTLDIFEGSKQTVDYYGMFDTEYFVACMVMFLDAF